MDLFGAPTFDIAISAVLCVLALIACAFLLHDGLRVAFFPTLMSLEAQVNALTGKREALDADIAEGRRTLEDIARKEAERRTLEATLETLTASRTDLESRLAELEPKRLELATLDTRLDERRMALESLEAQARSVGESAALLQADVARLTREQEQLRADLDDLAVKRDALAETTRTLQAEEARARDSLARTGEAITEAEARVAELVKAGAELAAASRAAETSQHLAEDALKRARAEMAELQGALDAARTERGRLLTETAGRTQELEGLAREKAAVAGEIAAGRESLAAMDRAQAEARLSAETLARRRDELTAEIARLGERRDVLASELATRSADRTALDGTLADLRRSRDALEDQQRRLTADIEPLQEKKQLLTLAVADLEQKKAALEKRGAAGTGAGGAETAQDRAQAAEAVLGTLLDARPGVLAGSLTTRPPTETEALGTVRKYLADQGLKFPDRLVNAFHTALKIADISPLTVLAGISGTGKSELPRRYAEAIGLPFLQLAVQPRWDSPQDLFGFYNYIEGRYKPTELLRLMVQLDVANWPEQAKDYRDHMALVLLDEMNLARVEYYFSEFLSRLEIRRDRDDEKSAAIELDFGGRDFSGVRGIRGNRVYPVRRLLFVGTMNEDESTQSLSDKVVDRANVLRFPRPKNLTVAGGKTGSVQKQRELLPFRTWESWRRKRGSDSRVDRWLDALNTAMEQAGRPFGFRMGHAIASYIANYPGGAGDQTLALADQLEMRLFPKLRGVDPLDEHVSRGLEALEKFMHAELPDDAPLAAAFRTAREGDQFLWRGVDRGD